MSAADDPPDAPITYADMRAAAIDQVDIIAGTERARVAAGLVAEPDALALHRARVFEKIGELIDRVSGDEMIRQRLRGGGGGAGGS